ncbi:MAG: hypothetical protein NZ839_01470, partial [Endomicrobia bacterium]|nr:hypothetical protein [Endomicrobiia bacterium]
FILFYLNLAGLWSLYKSLQGFDKVVVLGIIGSVVVFLCYGLVDEPFRAHFAPYVQFFLISIGYRLGTLLQK